MSEQTTNMLGRLAPADAKRDAIHIAVVPVVAGETLSPGDPVSIAGNGEAVVDTKKPLGVVDPFLLEIVDEGERFWLYLRPGTVTGMRHAWTHPAFLDEAAQPVHQDNVAKAVSNAWLLGWCRRFWPLDGDASEELLPYLLAGIEEGEVCFGITGYSQGMHYNEDTEEYELPEEFWHHYAVVTGKAKPGTPISFRCAC